MKIKEGKTIMRMIKKITPLIFLFSTVFGLNGTVSQVFETFENLCIKNPVLTCVAGSIVSGAGAGIIFESHGRLEQDEDKRTLLADLVDVFGTLALCFSVIFPFACSEPDIRHAMSEETARILPFITVPLYFASLVGTIYIIDKPKDVQNEQNETIEKE
jgi:hypothetical protein